MTHARPDPLKLKLLVETLRTGPFTYEDLEERADLQLSRRSLQLYLETHLPAAGHAVLRGRTSGPRPRATFALPRADATSDSAVNRAALSLARGVLAELFPVDGTDLDAWREALATPAAMVFLETPSNPMLDLVDLPAVSALAHAAGALVVVDNVFATPLLQRPLDLGADVVVYSCTKHMDGQGRALGGAVLGRAKWVDEVLQPYLRNTGPALSPFNAWVILKGLETLPLRVDAMCQRAAALASLLASHPAVASVRYPHHPSHPQHDLARRLMSAGGTLVTFTLRGGKAAAFRCADALRLVDISNNLGDAKSLITHPATTTHHRIGPDERARLGIADGTLRLSVGLEDLDDLREDLLRGLAAAGEGA